MTRTYNVNDSANWSCSVDGVAVPEAGDTLVFPANLADVDPGDTIDDNDESQWQYVVNNDLAAGTAFAGIQFTGDAGTGPSNDDGYKLEGNAIQLSGDVTVSYSAYPGPEINLDVEIVADVQLQV